MSYSVVITGASFIDSAFDIKNLSDIFNDEIRLPDQKKINKISDINYNSYISNRTIRKLDKFCLNGIITAEEAIKSSELNLENIDKNRIGIYVGNCLGGWESIENQIIELHKQGVSQVGPYVATSWFPAALQGQLSLRYGIKGKSKTFSTESVSGLQAVGYAYNAIKNGEIDIAICGATEHLSSNLITRLINDGSKINNDLEANNYTESSAFIVLENEKIAKQRGFNNILSLDYFSDLFYCDEEMYFEHFLNNIQSFSTNNKISLITNNSNRNKIKELIKNNKLGDSTNRINHVKIKSMNNERFSVNGILEIALITSLLREKKSIKNIDNPLNKFNVMLQRTSKSGHLTTIGLSIK